MLQDIYSPVKNDQDDAKRILGFDPHSKVLGKPSPVQL